MTLYMLMKNMDAPKIQMTAGIDLFSMESSVINRNVKIGHPHLNHKTKWPRCVQNLDFLRHTNTEELRRMCLSDIHGRYNSLIFGNIS